MTINNRSPIQKLDPIAFTNTTTDRLYKHDNQQAIAFTNTTTNKRSPQLSLKSDRLY
jgi:hypothetical protein